MHIAYRRKYRAQFAGDLNPCGELVHYKKKYERHSFSFKTLFSKFVLPSFRSGLHYTYVLRILSSEPRTCFVVEILRRTSRE
jgi:3-methyladenine DNA glycosylase Tag